tara:strand:+ start:136 stop:576 length:441 start_codon:yes stop_codon:yes gene_type:complete
MNKNTIFGEYYMKHDPTIFGDKKFSNILEEIHKNSADKRVQIDLLISELTGYIQTAGDVVQIVPLISQYLEVAVKNDEQLVKLATLIQRLMSVEVKGSEQSTLLTEQEKEQLLKSLDDTVKDLQVHSDSLQGNINKVKDSTKGIGD